MVEPRRPPEAEAPGDAPAVVRELRHAVAMAEAVTASGSVPSADTERLAKATAIAVVSGPVAPLPARPTALEVAPAAARADTPTTPALGQSVLLVGRQPHGTGRGPANPRRSLAATGRPVPLAGEGPAAAARPVDLRPPSTGPTTTVEPAGQEADRPYGKPLQVAVKRPGAAAESPTAIPRSLGPAEDVRAAPRPASSTAA